jgi:hypothetical protein
MVGRQLLRLSSAMSGGVLVCIRHHFGCCIRLLHHAVAIHYMNVHFLLIIIMHQICNRHKRYNTFSGKQNTLVKFNCQIFIYFQSVYWVMLLTY